MVKKDDQEIENVDAAVEELTPTVEELQIKIDDLVAKSTRVDKANKRLHKMQNAVAQSTQANKSAAAQLKRDIGLRDKAAIELQRIIDDVKNGQEPLPGMDNPDDDDIAPQAPVGTAENWPISELGNKRLKSIVGPEAFAAAKDSDDPIGLSDKQIENLESADFATIAELEKCMKEDSWWHKKVAKDPGAAIIQRVISSLLAFRKVHPLPVDERTPTVLEKLAEQNAPEPEAVPSTETAA